MNYGRETVNEINVKTQIDEAAYRKRDRDSNSTQTIVTHLMRVANI